ncbi:uncharacterized protein K489DRAFT_379580 [Dissoconium aciculare CBS 342.82]|uniref:Uncharacterized protein n=1 Tax=Dissoconium aciculare CBS 342.82 TaxID=1314786 RepID=A0A6J3M7P9_9PEZI|nr:uncharacterized protein K489DRAFT_379580 [Dissoconium aciculare CBS 342.82]KAF1823584.1 hypothetical protein K489DRAFT_379580 [Dissoconium aciculare CBS 342.82]
MSNQSSNSFSSSVSYTSSSTSNNNGETTGYRSSHTTLATPSGTTVTSSSQNYGGPAVTETRHFDSQGRAVESSGNSSGRVIEDFSKEEQAKRDAEYEERIEEEYAKREGGA